MEARGHSLLSSHSAVLASTSAASLPDLAKLRTDPSSPSPSSVPISPVASVAPDLANERNDVGSSAQEAFSQKEQVETSGSDITTEKRIVQAESVGASVSTLQRARSA